VLITCQTVIIFALLPENFHSTACQGTRLPATPSDRPSVEWRPKFQQEIESRCERKGRLHDFQFPPIAGNYKLRLNGERERDIDDEDTSTIQTCYFVLPGEVSSEMWQSRDMRTRLYGGITLINYRDHRVVLQETCITRLAENRLGFQEGLSSMEYFSHVTIFWRHFLMKLMVAYLIKKFCVLLELRRRFMSVFSVSPISPYF